MNKKHIITAFVIGILATIFAYHAYTVYSFRSALVLHENRINEITSFINSAVQASQAK